MHHFQNIGTAAEAKVTLQGHWISITWFDGLYEFVLAFHSNDASNLHFFDKQRVTGQNSRLSHMYCIAASVMATGDSAGIPNDVYFWKTTVIWSYWQPFCWVIARFVSNSWASSTCTCKMLLLRGDNMLLQFVISVGNDLSLSTSEWNAVDVVRWWWKYSRYSSRCWLTSISTESTGNDSECSWQASIIHSFTAVVVCLVYTRWHNDSFELASCRTINFFKSRVNALINASVRKVYLA